nr:filamentous hemagglutinin N-terminal domain-containing protein [Puniceibacterium sediminis]
MPARAQSVVSDGATATGITIESSGLVSVDIAPARAAVSHNTYSRFDVPTVGLQLNNTGVGAQTIVNEVTSSMPSALTGPLEVVGSQADVIIANPNGITVNGGRFVNTGNVALTTGRMSGFDSGQLGASVANGAIRVEGDGLAGTMAELALISRSLRLAAAIDDDGAGTHLNIFTGAGEVSFDRQRGGFGQDGSGTLPWALTSGAGGGGSDGVIVDITGDARLNAGRISLRVTDRGAGVRLAGDHLASVGGFRLTSSGQLEVDGARVTAKGSVAATAGSVVLRSDEGRRSEMSSLISGITLEASAGDIDLGQARLAGRLVSSDNFASQGGVTLTATGQITAAGQGERTAELISEAGDMENPLVGSNIVLTALGGMAISGLSLQADDDIRATSDGALLFEGVTGTAGGDLSLHAGTDVRVDASVLSAQSDVIIDGEALRFGSGASEQARTEIRALEGGMILRAQAGDVLNYGSLLQGKTTPTGISDVRGGMTILAAGSVLNRSLSVDRLAVAYGEQDALYIQTGGDLSNETGRLFSNGEITLDLGGDLFNETQFTLPASPITTKREVGPRLASTLFLKRARKTEMSGDFGERSIDGEQSYILGIGDVAITARNIHSIGADITGADVTLSALAVLSNDARQVGRISFRERCRWFCRTSGQSDLALVGGTMTASGHLSVSAGSGIASRAGSFTGVAGLTMTAPRTELTGMLVPQLIERPSGLMGLFSGTSGFVLSDYLFGSLQSGGTITIDGDAEPGGADLLGAGSVVITGTEIAYLPQPLSFAFERRPLGFYWNLFR